MKFPNAAFDEISEDRSDTFSSYSQNRQLLSGWLKRSTWQKHGLRIGMIIGLCFVVLVIIVVTAVIVTRKEENNAKALSSTKNEIIYGTLTITDRKFTEALLDTGSAAYKNLSMEICSPITETNQEVKCNVKNFWEGSVKALFELTVAERLAEAVKQDLTRKIKNQQLWTNLETKEEVLSMDPLVDKLPKTSTENTQTPSTPMSTTITSTPSSTQSSTTISTSTASTTSTTANTTASTTLSSSTTSVSSSTSTVSSTTTPTTPISSSASTPSSTTTTSSTTTSMSTTSSTMTSTRSTTLLISTTSSALAPVSVASRTVPSTTTPKIVTTPLIQPYPNITGRIRVVGGSTPAEGRLEVLYKGKWGTVCDDNFGPVEAKIACKSLGYDIGIELTEAYFGEGQDQIWLDDVECTDDDRNLLECVHRDWGVNDCDHSEDVGVRCEHFANFTGKVRLTGGNTHSAGRLEVEVDGVWGTVCDDYFSDNAAEVFCEVLGISPNPGFKPMAIGGAFFGPAEQNVPIWFDDVICGDPKMGIPGCSMSQFHNCRHHEDVSLVCQGEAQVRWEMRLVDSSSDSSGHVQVKTNLHDSWGYICDDYWNTMAAGLVCKELGFGDSAVSHVGSYFHNLTNTSMSTSSITFALDDVLCEETMTSLRQCSHLPWGKHNCRGSEIAGVTCLGDITSIIRLVGSLESSGRVEIFHRNQWGTVCDDSFDSTDATVICRMLGYDAGTVLPSSRGIGPIWLDDLKCKAADQSIFDCEHNGWGVHNCDHTEDAGVRCFNMAGGNDSKALYFTDTRRKNVFRMSAAGGVHLPVGGSTRFFNPIAIAHDPVKGYIYWTERASESIVEAKHKGIGRLEIATNEISFIPLPTNYVPDGLAVDYISNLLYLTDTGNDIIQVIDFEKKTNRTLLTTGFQQPRAIVVDPESGWMYWTDWGSSPDIEKAHMDGNNRTKLVTTGLRWPNGLTLDKPAQRLYFCEARSPRSVQSVTLDGGDRKIHFSSSSSSYTFFGIALDENYIYMTSWGLKYVMRLAKSSVGASSVERLGPVVPGSVRLNSILLVGSTYQQTGKNKCSTKNGGCSHYCVPVPENAGGSVCSCPDDMLLNGNQCEHIPTAKPATTPTTSQLRNFTSYANIGTHTRTSYTYTGTRSSAFQRITNSIMTTPIRPPPTLPPVTHMAKTSPILQAKEAFIDMEAEKEELLTLRLTSGHVASEGRVEVYNNNTGSWIRFCAEVWNFSAATEVCKSLGYDYGIAYVDGYFGKGNGTAFLNDCKSGNLTSDLTNCIRSDCGDAKDAGVACYGGKDNSSAVRLVGGKDKMEGRLEVKYKDKWGVVCDDTWNHDVAAIVCKMLGHLTGVARRESHFGVTKKIIWLDTIYCDPTETNLFACQNDDWGVTDCDNYEEAGVKCISDYSSVISLVGDEKAKHRGIVSVLDIFNDATASWGWMCGANFGRIEARVACQMLGYLSGEVDALEDPAAIVNNSTMTWLAPQCQPEASSLFECNLQLNPRTTCLGNTYAIVRCSYEMSVENLINCTFEGDSRIETKLCPLRNVAQKLFYLRRGSSFSSSGPCYDNTMKRSSGYHMWTSPSLLGQFLIPAIMESKQFYQKRESCLSFYYHMYGTGIFYLTVYANYSVAGVNHTLNLLNVTRVQGDIWWKHQSTLPPGQFSVVFEAGSSSSSGNVALDDILLRTESCATESSDFSCDFESVACNTSIASCSGYSWKQWPASRLSTIPADHTYQSSLGIVMSLSYMYRSGPAYFALPQMNISSLAHLRFYYYLSIRRSSTTVYVQARHNDGKEQELWRINQESEVGSWAVQEILLPAGLFQIAFVGDVSSGTFALDDITVTSLSRVNYVEELTCNFDHGKLCDLKNVMSDHGDWKVRTPRIFLGSRSSSGPCRDFSLGSNDGGFLYTSLTGLAYPWMSNSTRRFKNFIRMQHYLGRTRSVMINSPQIYVAEESCLRFYLYLQSSNETAFLVNISSGADWWISGEDTRTWREVALPLQFGLSTISFNFVSITPESHTAAIDGISIQSGSCNDTLEDTGESLQCDFESSSFCSYVSSCPDGDGVQWSLGTSESEQITDDEYAPGTFAYLKHNKPGKYSLASKRADLVFQSPQCLTFKYILKGGADISVELGSVSADQNNVLLWMQNQITTKWLEARVELDGIADASRVIISVTSKQQNQEFFAAVDSVDIINSTCPIEIKGIRLYQGIDRRSGKLQVDMNGIWHEICTPRGSDQQAMAATACKELGHWPLTFGSMMDRAQRTPGVPVLPGLFNCSEDASSISNCTYVPCKSCCRTSTSTEITCIMEQPVLRQPLRVVQGVGFAEVFVQNRFVRVVDADSYSTICSHLHGNGTYDTRYSVSLRSPGKDFGVSISCQNHTEIRDCSFTLHVQPERELLLSCTKNQTSVVPSAAPGCDFEDGLCGYEQSIDDDQDWHLVTSHYEPYNIDDFESRLTSGIKTSGTGPHSASLLRSWTARQFIAMDATSPSRKGFTARISTPEFNSENKCLRFAYNLRGIGGSMLYVYQQSNDKAHLLGTFNQSSSGRWKGVTYQLESSETSRVIFEAQRGSRNQGDVAIDDVEIGNDCQDKCPGDSFQCSDGTCIPSFRVCDNVLDCDGTLSDEAGCSCKNDDDFQCANGVCIPGKSKCDGVPSCAFPDVSDEKGCSCLTGEFQCQNGACILPHLVCDHTNNCGDWSDEKNCTNCNDTTNAPGFLCPGKNEGYCIGKRRQCDGVFDCTETKADEKGCHNCSFNGRNPCHLRIPGAIYKLHPNTTDNYYVLARFGTTLTMAPIESTSCLSLRILNGRQSIFNIMKDHIGKTEHVTTPVGSWTDVKVTLKTTDSSRSHVKIHIYNVSLDDISLARGSCPPDTSASQKEITCTFSKNLCGFAAVAWSARTKNIRLVGNNPSEGRLEIFFNGTWGTVCDDSFGSIDATIACNTLGYSGGRARCCAHYGRGTGPILWTNVRCSSSETNFFECGYSPARSACIHSEDVGVQCYGAWADVVNANLANGEGLTTDPNATQILSVLTRPVSSMRCMKFRYRMPRGLYIVAGGLDVRNKNPFTSRFFGENGTTVVKVTDTSLDWRTAEIPLSGEAGHVFLIAAAVEDTHIAVDNVTFSRNLCTNSQETCENGLHRCKFTLECYSSDSRCDGMSDCLDHSDEMNCSSESYTDFNDGSFGPGYQESNGIIKWQTTSGNAPSNWTGPKMSRDHLPDLSLLHLEGIPIGNVGRVDYSIPGVKMGKYAYAGMSGGQLGDTAILKFNTNGACMRFHYSAVGDEDSSLSISINGNVTWYVECSRVSNHLGGLLSQSGWRFAQVNLSTLPSEVRFIATSGYTNGGIIALDDIVFLNKPCPPPVSCPAETFSCGDGNCIQKWLTCDGHRHCGNGSDEARSLCRWSSHTTTRRPQRTSWYSTTVTTPTAGHWLPSTKQPPTLAVFLPLVCRQDQFQCSNGHCISQANRCDFWDDCEDGSDEFNCTSKTCSGVMCDTGYCVRKHLLGQGNSWCPDAMDARMDNIPQGCSGFVCDGFCLPWSKYCDKVTDCKDGRDEHEDCECRGDQLTCDSGECRPVTDYCDQRPSCSDYSDEPSVCECFPEVSFRCGTNECIRKSQRCDAKIDCTDASDEENCTCIFGQYQCANGMCIDNSKFCDGVQHCLDGSDEHVNCSCRADQFDCGDRCIPLGKRCDGVSDCASHKDEFLCDTCPQKQCTDGSCILETLVCDGKMQCNDGSDESFCKCAVGEFSCQNGMCIPQLQKCDGMNQCGDFSDEIGCSCLSETAVQCNSSGLCIEQTFLCDGYPDCADGEDEKGCAISEYPGVCQAGEILCNKTCLSANSPCPRGEECDKYAKLQPQNDCDCGRKIASHNATAEASNQHFTSIHSWPWHVDVIFKGKSICSGVLISRYWILTTGRCITMMTSRHNPDHYRFMMGSSNRIKASPHKVFSYASALFIEKFDPNSNGLVLFRVGSPVVFSKYVTPICLPKNNDDHPVNNSKVCFTMGWDKESPGSVSGEEESKYLQEQRIPPQSCLTARFGLPAIGCTLTHPPSTCLRETQGPLACLQNDGRWLLQGIGATSVCSRNYYGFIDVSSSVDWITNVIGRWKN